MKTVSEKHIGTVIGINIDKVQHFDAVELLGAFDSYLSVRSSTDQHVHHIPYTNVLKIVEDEGGVEIRHLFTSNERFRIIVKIGHVIVQTIA